MKNLISGFLIAIMVLSLLVLQASAGIVTADEARSVAENWVALKIGQQGNWGGSPTAQIGEVREFRRGDRLIGYFCPVNPWGFIIVPLRRELAPVKAYSDTSSLDPDSDEGIVALMKEKMAGILDTIEREAGPVESASSSAVASLMEVNYLESWEILSEHPSAFPAGIQGIVTAANYQQKGVLLSSCWTQHAPYYDQTPAPPSGSTCYESHCTVGCGPLMAGQIMRYWAWPPYRDPSRPYTWSLMSFNQSIQVGAGWVDEFGKSISQGSINEVARLLFEIGIEAGADYCEDGCGTETCFATCPGKDLLDTFEDHFRFSTSADNKYRSSESNVDWFNRIKNEINANRPIPYRVTNHFIICDGWQENIVGGVVHMLYHMNYDGGITFSNTWWELDELPAHDKDEEQLLINIYPAQALSPFEDKVYPRESFPYRYIDQDISGNSATFSAGQYIQFLPGVTMTCNSGTGTAIRIESSGSDLTRLFSRGDASKGVSMSGGTVRLNRGGGMVVR